MHGGKAAFEDDLEIIDPRLEARLEPRRSRILVRHPLDPLGLDPFLESLRSARGRVDIPIGALPLGRRGVEVADQLHCRVDRL